MVRSHNGDTDFFDIVTGVLQGDTLTPYLFNLSRLHSTNVNRSKKRKWFHIKKEKRKKADDTSLKL